MPQQQQHCPPEKHRHIVYKASKIEAAINVFQSQNGRVYSLYETIRIHE
jgi:hypothetical protein